MTRFQFFESGYGLIGVEMGIISPSVYMKYIRYRVFLDFMHTNIDKMTAIEFTAERNKCDRSTIYRDIEFFAT